MKLRIDLCEKIAGIIMAKFDMEGLSLSERRHVLGLCEDERIINLISKFPNGVHGEKKHKEEKP